MVSSFYTPWCYKSWCPVVTRHIVTSHGVQFLHAMLLQVMVSSFYTPCCYKSWCPVFTRHVVTSNVSSCYTRKLNNTLQINFLKLRKWFESCKFAPTQMLHADYNCDNIPLHWHKCWHSNTKSVVRERLGGNRYFTKIRWERDTICIALSVKYCLT